MQTRRQTFAQALEAVEERRPANLAAIMGRGHSWLYAFLSRHRDVTWVKELLSR